MGMGGCRDYEEWKTGPLFTVYAEVRPDTDIWWVVLDMDTDDGEW